MITGKEMVKTLDSLSEGTPLLIDVGTGEYTQVIYMGIGEVQYQPAYLFYDGEGVNGQFGETKRFILNNPGTVSIILDDNDPSEVSKLLKDIKGGTTMKRHFRVDASKKIKSAKSTPSLHQAFDGLDDRFDFDLDDEFEIYVRNDTITCYTIDSKVFGNGAGVSYTVAIPIGEGDFWDIDRFIQRGLEEYLSEQLDGSDYTYGVNEISKDPMFDVDTADIPANVDTYNLYFADVEIVPFQNISPYGEYGIDAGYEE